MMGMKIMAAPITAALALVGVAFKDGIAPVGRNPLTEQGHNVGKPTPIRITRSRSVAALLADPRASFIPTKCLSASMTAQWATLPEGAITTTQPWILSDGAELNLVDGHPACNCSKATFCLFRDRPQVFMGILLSHPLTVSIRAVLMWAVQSVQMLAAGVRSITPALTLSAGSAPGGCRAALLSAVEASVL